jgi:hypothetical protein
MGLTNEQVSTLFAADYIVGAPPTVGSGGAGGGQGLGSVSPNTYVATSSGVYGRMADVQAAQKDAGAVPAYASAGQSGGRRRSRRKLHIRRSRRGRGRGTLRTRVKKV